MQGVNIHAPRTNRVIRVYIVYIFYATSFDTRHLTLILHTESWLQRGSSSLGQVRTVDVDIRRSRCRSRFR